MTACVLPQYLSTPRGQLFSVLHQPVDTPHALLLVCPPFFHEHVRSYRLFSLLGEALANAGIAVMRFDYVGTGDSDGDDEQFTLDGACSDAMIAAGWLQQRWPDAPLSIMGVRAGSHPALQAGGVDSVHRRLLWQPVLDWTQYVLALEQLDAEQRLTVPGLTKGDTSTSLMGFPCTTSLRSQLRDHRLTLPPPDALATWVMLSEQAPAPSLDAALYLPLPTALSQWAGEVDMAQFPSRPIRDLAAVLAPHLVSPQRADLR